MSGTMKPISDPDAERRSKPAFDCDACHDERCDRCVPPDEPEALVCSCPCGCLQGLSWLTRDGDRCPMCEEACLP